MLSDAIKSNLFRAFISGFILLSIISVGELIGGTTRIVLGFVSVLWLITSGVIFVTGKGVFDWIKGRQSYWDVNKPILIRLFLYICGMILAALIFKAFT